MSGQADRGGSLPATPNFCVLGVPHLLGNALGGPQLQKRQLPAAPAAPAQVLLRHLRGRYSTQLPQARLGRDSAKTQLPLEGTRCPNLSRAQICMRLAAPGPLVPTLGYLRQYLGFVAASETESLVNSPQGDREEKLPNPSWARRVQPACCPSPRLFLLGIPHVSITSCSFQPARVFFLLVPRAEDLVAPDQTFISETPVLGQENGSVNKGSCCQA